MPRRPPMASKSGKGRPGRRAANPAPVSVRGLARRLGVSHTAIAKAAAAGRLQRSTTRRGGHLVVLDAALAAEEWAASSTRPAPGPAAPAPGGDTPGTPIAPPGATSVPAAAQGGTLVAAQLEVAKARATSIRILNRMRAGRLIDAEAARREAFESARTIRDAVLAVPDRLAAELAAERDAARVHARLRDELRAALEAAAEILARGA